MACVASVLKGGESVFTYAGFITLTPEGRETFEKALLTAKRDEALSLYVKRLREQAKDDIKVDESYIQEAKVDGGAGPAEEDEEQY